MKIERTREETIRLEHLGIDQSLRHAALDLNSALAAGARLTIMNALGEVPMETLQRYSEAVKRARQDIEIARGIWNKEVRE